MNKKLFLGLGSTTMIFALILTFSSFCFAQPQGQTPEGKPMPAWMSAPDGPEKQEAFMKSQDKDGDGKVAREEFQGPDMLWNQFDANKDGFIELSEAPEKFERPPRPEGGGGGSGERGAHVEGGTSGADFIAQFDLDKNGEVSHTEWETVKPTTPYTEKHWPEYDMNGDMILTLEEAPIKEGESEAAPEEKKFSVNINQMAFIVKFDTNKDGKIDNTEFTGVHFPVYDKNGDGFIEPDEAPEGETAY